MMLNETHYKVRLNFMSLFKNFCVIEVVFMWYLLYRTVG